MSQGSSFFEMLKDYKELPETILEFGCGQGRDSLAFARSGKTVIGVDRSVTGIESTLAKAKLEGIDTLAAALCNVSVREDVQDVIRKARLASSGDSICFYSRFFLHSIPEEAQDILLKTIYEQKQPGDIFAAEFRTDKDEGQTKVFGTSHYRRYQNADRFIHKLHSEYGWQETLYQIESNGLSPYKEEDPVLLRIVCRG